ncbi:MAG TPA: tetratricopeptide repeat protein [Bryobacteraceae bacterium]|jgi:tetratricopeptide (TPR) repeat protein|nr:tetratricopeptide repeat protein [Bryobacteraceae bacterium]
MRGRLLAMLLLSIPLGMPGAGPPGVQANQAIALIVKARQNRTEGYFYRAEAQYRRALAIVEQTFGAGSANLIPALNGLSELDFEARRYTEAEALSRRSAALVEATLGAGHPLMATALHDLAAIYHVQGQYAKAEPLYYRALAIRENTLGPGHPFVAATLANLAAMERAQGRRGRAAEHYARAVRISQGALERDGQRFADAWRCAAPGASVAQTEALQ